MSGRSVKASINGKSSEAKLRQRSKNAHGSAGIADVRAPLLGKPDRILAIVREGLCPFCERGPFKSVSGHTNHMHGVSARDLRDLCGVTTKESIATPELSAKSAERGRKEWAAVEEKMRVAREAQRATGAPLNHTQAGLAARRRTLDKARVASGQAAAMADIAERRAKAAAMREARSRQRAEVAAEVERLVTTTNLPMRDIAERVGVVPRTVRMMLKRRGVILDGRNRRWHGNSEGSDAL